MSILSRFIDSFAWHIGKGTPKLVAINPPERKVYMEEGKVTYCKCDLPIRMYQRPGVKNWVCSLCQLQVNPKSKMLDRSIEKIKLVHPTVNELVLQQKINEISDLLKVLGG